ncbi:MAG TPA: 3-oxoacyl-ACP reductase family protein [Burkholderiales bacterium]|nr:3-oxoacyl-ACP reductase family protein [Burkholderiales bacterium]
MESNVAIVTGGSRGIGRAIAQALAASGHRVMLSFREREADAQAVVDGIKRQGGEACCTRADVGAPRDAKALAQEALDAFGRIDVLVNNAGVHLPGLRFADVTPDQWARLLQVNLTGPLLLTQAVLPHMRSRRSGCVINLSSNVTQRMPAGFGAYAVSKVGLEAFTRILAKEEGPNGIRVNAVAPGPIRTEMLQETLDLMGAERAQAFLKSVPLGRAGEPEEIAATVAFLASNAASYLTGQVIYVNGGGPGG